MTAYRFTVLADQGAVAIAATVVADTIENGLRAAVRRFDEVYPGLRAGRIRGVYATGSGGGQTYSRPVGPHEDIDSDELDEVDA